MTEPSAPGISPRRFGRRGYVVAGLGTAALATWLWMATYEPPPKSFWFGEGNYGLRDAPDGASVDGAWCLRRRPADHAGAVGTIGPRSSLVRGWTCQLRAWITGQSATWYRWEYEQTSPDLIPFVMLQSSKQSSPSTWRFCVTHVAGLPEQGRCPPELVGTWDRELANGFSWLKLRADGTFTAQFARVSEGYWGVSDGYVLFESSSPPADLRRRFSVALWEPERNEMTRIDVGTETFPNEVYRRR